MSGKSEKTRGAEVRASRAKTRVEAKKKSRIKAHKPKVVPDSPSSSAASERKRRKRPESRDGAGVSMGYIARGAERRQPQRGSEKGNGRGPRTGEPGIASEARPSSVSLTQEKPRKERDKPRKERDKPAGRGREVHSEGTAVRQEARKREGLKARREAGGPNSEISEESTPQRKRSGASTVRTLILGTILIISMGLLLWVYTGTGVLNIKHVEVKGNEVLDADYLRSLSGITSHTHLIKMDVKKVEKALLSEPYIADVDITRHYPNTVILQITERQPTGVILQNGKYNLVDQEGMILESTDTLPAGLAEIKDLELPLLIPGVEIDDMGFATITSLLGSLPTALREMTTAVGKREGEGLYLEGGGTVVIYGEATDLSRKNAIALMALSTLVQRYGAVDYIDVSFPDHPVIKPSGAG